MLVEHARRLGWPMTPAAPRAIPPFYRHSDHSMPKAGTAPVDDRVPPLLVPRSRSNLQHRPDGTRSTLGSATAVFAQLAQWTSRRHTRSPGEAGGGRSDLCHHNDETDSVNRRAGIGDNSIEPPAHLITGHSDLFQFSTVWLTSRDEQLTADLQEWKSQFGDDGEGAKRPRGCHIERFSCRPAAVVLESRMHHRQVGEA